MSSPRTCRARTGPRPAGRGRRALVQVLFLACLSLLAVLGTAATAGTRAGTTPEPSSPGAPADPLAVTIDTLDPSVLPTSGTLVVSGSVTNRSETDWTELSVYLVVSGGPITTEQGLAEAVVSDPRTDVGSRIVTPGLYVDIPDLAPGETTGYRLSVPSDALATNGQPGVYWTAVHVLGTSDQGRLEGADGRARTFLPFVPDGAPATELALGVQLRGHVERTPLGRLAEQPRWSRALGEQGDLGRLVRLTARTDTWPLTWVVDPAVVGAAVATARGNPPLDLARAPDGADAPGDDGDERSAAALRAEEWVALFSEEVQDHPVLVLPYADVDVAGAHAAGASELVETAFATGRQLLEELEVTGSPVVPIEDERVAAEAVDTLGPDVTVLLAPEAVEGGVAAGPVLTREDGRRVVVTPTAPVLAGPGPGAQDSALDVRQRLLADAALHALSSDPERPLVRLLPAGWDPGARWANAAFFDGLDVPWLTGTSLGALTTGAPAAGEAELVPPDAEAGTGTGGEAGEPGPLPATAFRAAEELIATGSELDELLTVNDVFAEEVTRQALTSVSRWARDRPWAAVDQAREALDRVEGWLAQVTVRSPSFVTMSSESGTFQVSLINELDQPVTVGLDATVDGDGLRVTAPPPVEIGPNSRGAMLIDAFAADIGVHQVTLQPVSAAGTEIGDPTTLSIRSSRVGFILWVVMAVGGALLFVAVTIRIVGRLRARRRTDHRPHHRTDREADRPLVGGSGTEPAPTDRGAR